MQVKIDKQLMTKGSYFNVYYFFCALSCALLFVIASNIGLAQQARIIPRPPDIAATSYVLMDATTGDILVESNADIPLPPASLTKIMTDYVVANELENGNITLDDEVYMLKLGKWTVLKCLSRKARPCVWKTLFMAWWFSQVMMPALL